MSTEFPLLVPALSDAGLNHTSAQPHWCHPIPSAPAWPQATPAVKSPALTPSQELALSCAQPGGCNSAWGLQISLGAANQPGLWLCYCSPWDKPCLALALLGLYQFFFPNFLRDQRSSGRNTKKCSWNNAVSVVGSFNSDGEKGFSWVRTGDGAGCVSQCWYLENPLTTVSPLAPQGKANSALPFKWKIKNYYA